MSNKEAWVELYKTIYAHVGRTDYSIEFTNEAYKAMLKAVGKEPTTGEESNE